MASSSDCEYVPSDCEYDTEEYDMEEYDWDLPVATRTMDCLVQEDEECDNMWVDPRATNVRFQGVDQVREFVETEPAKYVGEVTPPPTDSELDDQGPELSGPVLRRRNAVVLRRQTRRTTRQTARRTVRQTTRRTIRQTHLTTRRTTRTRDGYQRDGFVASDNEDVEYQDDRGHWHTAPFQWPAELARLRGTQ